MYNGYNNDLRLYKGVIMGPGTPWRNNGQQSRQRGGLVNNERTGGARHDTYNGGGGIYRDDDRYRMKVKTPISHNGGSPHRVDVDDNYTHEDPVDPSTYVRDEVITNDYVSTPMVYLTPDKVPREENFDILSAQYIIEATSQLSDSTLIKETVIKSAIPLPLGFTYDKWINAFGDITKLTDLSFIQEGHSLNTLITKLFNASNDGITLKSMVTDYIAFKRICDRTTPSRFSDEEVNKFHSYFGNLINREDVNEEKSILYVTKNMFFVIQPPLSVLNEVRKHSIKALCRVKTSATSQFLNELKQNSGSIVIIDPDDYTIYHQ